MKFWIFEAPTILTEFTFITRFDFISILHREAAVNTEEFETRQKFAKGCSGDWALNLCLNHDTPAELGCKVEEIPFVAQTVQPYLRLVKYCQYFLWRRTQAFFNVQILNFLKSCQYYLITEERIFLGAALEDWAPDFCANKSGLQIANWKCVDRKISWNQFQIYNSPAPLISPGDEGDPAL